MAKRVPHEITLYALAVVDGRWIIQDAVYTSRRYANRFVRRWFKDIEVEYIAAVKPGFGLPNIEAHARAIR